MADGSDKSTGKETGKMHLCAVYIELAGRFVSGILQTSLVDHPMQFCIILDLCNLSKYVCIYLTFL